jgi:hypothetical protein
MSITEGNFKSQMLRALYGLQQVQFALMNVEEKAPLPGEKIQQAWSLLWANFRSCVTLISVIRASTAEQGTPAPGPEDTRSSSALTSPIVSQDSPEFVLLVDLIERSIRSTEQMRRHTASAYETLIHVGQGDSDCGHTVNLCRLYGDTVEGLLETIARKLQLPRAVVAN